MHYLDEAHIFLFLVQVALLLLLTRGLGELFRRWRQPALTAELLVGVLLGPTLLGRFLPALHGALFPPDTIQQTMLETLAWFGVLFLLLETGLAIDFSVAWRQRGQALTIAFADIILPMVVAFVPCVLLPAHYLAQPDRRLLFALFMATVMTISAMPVAARALHDLNLLKTDLGFLTMSALAVNDIIGWVLFTIVLALFTQASVRAGSLLAVLAATVGFAALALTVGRRLSTRALELLRCQGLPEPATSFTFACLLGLLFGAVTQKLGVHALFGFFLAGVVIGEAHNLSEETRGIISQMVYALFVPLFFASIGLKLDFAANFDVVLVGLITLVGIAGRYAGAWVGVRLTRQPRANRHLIAVAHTPGGMMEIVVALLALETGLITARVFVAIVFSAVFSSVVLGPWLSQAMQRRRAARLLTCLAPEGVLPALTASSREEAIRTLAVAAAGGNRELAAVLADSALAREQEFGTGVGNGIAIPHARLAAVARPVLAIGRVPQGLDWNAPDGQPVRQVFFLVTPAGADDEHVRILAQIGHVLQDARNRARLEQAADGPAFRQALNDLFDQAPPRPAT